MTTRTKTKRTVRKTQAAKTTKAKSTKRRAAKQSKASADGSPAGKQPTEPRTPALQLTSPQPKDDSQELVVFAFRMTRAERDLIHEVAGPAKASRFVRTVALAAAHGDEEALSDAIEAARKRFK